MITPIKDEVSINKCSSVLLDMIPSGSVVDSYAFYGGKIEFDIASNNIFVNACTVSKPVYFFWQCLRHDPERLYEMISATAPRFNHAEEFTTLQEIWHQHESPFIVASMFFILNRCSENGLVSCGELVPENYTPLALSRLKKFAFPEHFYLTHSNTNPVDRIIQETDADYILLPAGKFSYNLFEYGKNIGIENTPLNHRHVAHAMSKSNHKVVAIYNYHNALSGAFKDAQLTMIDRHGRVTDSRDKAEEVIVANF